MTTANELETQAGRADNLEQELGSLPEKLKGKTAKEIADMYLELEKVTSRQGNELGEYRKLTNSLLEAQSSKETQEPVERRVEVTADELLTDPNKAIDNAINSHPAVKRAAEATEELEKKVAHKDFEAKHPSYKEDVQDPKFVEWIKKNRTRQELARMADNFNFDAAEELWAMWDEHKTSVKEIEEARKERAEAERKRKEKDGILEGASGTDSSNEAVLDRQEIKNLHRQALLGDRAAMAKWNNPKFQEMRLKAYRDKRVK